MKLDYDSIIQVLENDSNPVESKSDQNSELVDSEDKK